MPIIFHHVITFVVRNERRPRNVFNQYSISGVRAGLTTRLTSPPCRTRSKESRGDTSPTCRTHAKQCRRRGEGKNRAESATQGEKAHPRIRRRGRKPIPEFDAGGESPSPNSTQGRKPIPEPRRSEATTSGARPNLDRLCDLGIDEGSPSGRTNGREIDFRGSRKPE